MQEENRLSDLQESALPVGNKESVFGSGIVFEKAVCYDWYEPDLSFQCGEQVFWL